MAALLGKGYIELAVKYDGALSQVKGDLAQVGEEGKKTGEAIKSHVENAVKGVQDEAAKASQVAAEARQAWVQTIRENLAAQKELTDAQNKYYSKQVGDLKEIMDLRHKAAAAQKAHDDAMWNSLQKHREELRASGRDWSDQIARGMQRSTDEFHTWQNRTFRQLSNDIAPSFGAAMGSMIAKPITLAIGGIRWAFTELFDFAVGAAKTAFYAIGGTLAAGVSTAFYQGIKRLDDLATVRLKMKYDGLDSKQTEDVIEDVRALSKRIGSPFSELLNQSEVFVAAGVKEGSDIVRVLEMAANVAEKTGQSIGSVSDTMLRFMEGNTQRATQVLQTWEQGGVSITRWLADDLGVAQTAIWEMLQKGQISWAEVQRALEDNLAGFAEQSGETISAKIGLVWEAVKDIGEAALEPFFGTAVNGVQGIVDKLEGWAQWLRDHQPQIVEWVGQIGVKFMEIAAQVTEWAASTIEAFGGVVRAMGLVIDHLPGTEKTTQSLNAAADGIDTAAAKMRDSIPFWENGAQGIRSYMENLHALTVLRKAGTWPIITPDGRVLVTGEKAQLGVARGELNKIGLEQGSGWKNVTDEKGNPAIEILPDSEQGKRIIDDVRESMGREPLYMDVYLKYHNLPDKPSLNTAEVVKPEENKGFWANIWDKIKGEGLGAGGVQYYDEEGNLVKPEDIDAAASGEKPGVVKGSPGQGLPLPGYFNDPSKTDTSLKIGADPTPALETVGSFTEAIVESDPTPAPVTANTETGTTVVGEFLKAIKDALPTPAPITAAMDEAEKIYKQFVDMVKNTPLSIPMSASMMMGFGGMGGMMGQGGPNVSTAGLQPQSLAALNLIQSQFPGVPLISGWRASDPFPWHPSGRGLDLGVNANTPEGSALGDQMKAWLEANKAMLGINHVLWKVKDHFDHIHVGLNEGPSPLLMAMGGGMMPSMGGMDISASFGGSGGGPIRFGGGMGGGMVIRAPMLPGLDDTDPNAGGSGKGDKPWTPTTLPGVDPNYKKPQKGGYSGDYADPNADYLPDSSGYLGDVLSSPMIDPKEAERLQGIADSLAEKEAALNTANMKLGELRQTDKVKPSTLAAAQNRVKSLENDVNQLRAKLEAAKSTALESDATNRTAGLVPDAGFFTDPSYFMTSPNITPDEAQKLSDTNDKLNDLTAQLSSAQERLAEYEANPDTKNSTLLTAQNTVNRLIRDKAQLERQFAEMQQKAPLPGDFTKKGKGGQGNSWWDQTLGEFVQKMSPDWGSAGDIISGGLKETFLPPGFSDPTQWGMTQAASGLMGWLGGIANKTGNPIGGALLGAGSAALGGSGGGMATSLMGLMPYPFGNFQIGSPGLAPGTAFDPMVADAGGGGGGLPLGAIPLPGVSENALAPHLPGGQMPGGQPRSAGPGNVSIDNSVNVQGDSQSAVTQHTIEKTQSMQAPKVRQYSNSLGRPNFYG